MAEEVEWADAASSCARHGGGLASIQDPSEQEFIKKNVEVFQSAHTSFWIGLYKTHKGSWQWLDKTVVDFTNWGEEEPRSDYGEVRSSDGKWSTGRRWHDRAYICETPKVIPGEDGSKAEPQGPQEAQKRSHNSLIVILVILVVSGSVAGAIFYYKRSPSSIPTFENPLYTERSQPDVVDTKTLIHNIEKEAVEPEPEPEPEPDNNAEPIISL